MDARSDISNTRGYSTDQQLELENLSIRKQALLDIQRDYMIVAFAVEESAINIRIEQAERRAEMSCKNTMLRIRIGQLLISCLRNMKQSWKEWQLST